MMHEYVNIKILGIIIEGMEQHCPHLLSNEILKNIPKNSDKVHVTIKKEVLNLVLKEGGAQLVLKLATALERKLDSSLLLFFLLNSPSPADLIRKLEQYDKYFHSSRQIKLVQGDHSQLVIDHVGPQNANISASEDLFICGLISFLLEKLGCQGLSVHWKQINDPRTLDYLDDDNIKALTVAGQCRWLYRWESFSVINSIPGLDNFLINTIKPTPINENIRISNSISNIVLKDLNRKWDLTELASKLNMSKRTLQRRLKEEGLSFAKLLNNIRIEQSLELLKNYELSLAEIGYLLGFSDSSHFNREFKKAKGVTPLTYRQQINDFLQPASLTAS